MKTEALAEAGASAAPFSRIPRIPRLSTFAFFVPFCGHYRLKIKTQYSTPMFLSPICLSQVPAPSPGTIENWLIPADAVASMALLFKKLFPRKHEVGRVVPNAPSPEVITRTEFHHEL